MISLSSSWPVSFLILFPPPDHVEEGEWESSWPRSNPPQQVLNFTSNCPDDFKNMNNTIEFIAGFIQVHKDIRICPLMIVLDLHHYWIPWTCAQQSSKSVALCPLQNKMLTYKNMCLICYNCKPGSPYETIETMLRFQCYYILYTILRKIWVKENLAARLFYLQLDKLLKSFNITQTI